MNTSQQVALKFNTERATKNNTKKIPLIAYHMYYKKYILPNISEGIDEIYNIAL